MQHRTILIFPDFYNIDQIQAIRNLYDPLCDLISPFIPVVYSFSSNISNEELKYILEKKLRKVNPFMLSIQHVSKQSDSSGHFLYLNIQQGAREIQFLHDQICKSILLDDSQDVFHPHMTIGRFRDQQSLENAYQMIGNFPDRFFTVVNHISVECIGEMGESIRLFDIPLKEIS